MDTFDAQTKKRLLERMEKRVQQGRAIGVHRLDPVTGIEYHYTPQQQIEEAKRGTPAGEEFLWAEKKLHDELERKRRI